MASNLTLTDRNNNNKVYLYSIYTYKTHQKIKAMKGQHCMKANKYNKIIEHEGNK